MKDVMIDLETLDTKPSTVILSIGACVFDRLTGEIGDTFYRVLDKDQIGRTTSCATIEWWEKQDSKLYKETVAGGMDLSVALQELAEWMPPGAIVWGNGATFDISILENAYGQKTPPWAFYNVRDVRTVVDLASKKFNHRTVVFKGRRHHALDDAVHQADYVAKAIQALGRI